MARSIIFFLFIHACSTQSSVTNLFTNTPVSYLEFSIYRSPVSDGIFYCAGQVIDSTTKAPLAFTRIQVNNSNRFIQADSNGFFRIDSLHEGDSLRFDYVGYTKSDVLVKNVPLRKTPN